LRTVGSISVVELDGFEELVGLGSFFDELGVVAVRRITVGDVAGVDVGAAESL